MHVTDRRSTFVRRDFAVILSDVSLCDTSKRSCRYSRLHDDHTYSRYFARANVKVEVDHTRTCNSDRRTCRLAQRTLRVPRFGQCHVRITSENRRRFLRARIRAASVFKAGVEAVVCTCRGTTAFLTRRTNRRTTQAPPGWPECCGLEVRLCGCDVSVARQAAAAENPTMCATRGERTRRSLLPCLSARSRSRSWDPCRP